MSSLNRALSGTPLVFDLNAERTAARAGFTHATAGRTARTLIKDGPMRVTMIALQAGGELAEHNADGPITVHVLEGILRFTTGGTEYILRAGQLLALGAQERHAVKADEDTTFLLTIAMPS